MFKANFLRTSNTVVAISGIFVLTLLMSGPVAEAAVAASDFGDSSDAPFGARRGVSTNGANAFHNLNTGEYFSSLQAAIDDADTANGHVLQAEETPISEGQVAITKSVTIQGQTGAEIIRANADTGSSGDDRGWFLVETGVSVFVLDLNFDGNGHMIHQAIRIKGDADITGCSFSDIRYNPSTNYAGTAIASIGACHVKDCDFSNIGRQGVLFYGPGAAGSLMESCTYEGKGGGDWLDYMVEIGAGAEGTVRNSYAEDCLGVASSDDSESSGVNLNTFFGGGTVAFVHTNTMMNCTFGVQVGLAVGDSSQADVHFNRLVGNEFGVGVNAVSNLDATNNWFGCNEGPGQPGCDATDGDPLVDPWLTLTIEAAPDSIAAFANSNVEAALLWNSDGVDTSGGGFVPDDIPMAFGATLGTVSPDTGNTVDAIVPTVFTAGGNTGSATVSVTCDNETVTAPIEIVGRVEAIPTLSFWGLMLLIMAVAALGIWVIKR